MKIFSFFQHPKFLTAWRIVTHPLLVFFYTNLLVYGIFLTRLGFYWDDLNFYWFYQQAGLDGIAMYFSTGRPVLGVLYQFFFKVLGAVPWHWQAFSFVWRWACAAAIYFLVRQLWKDRREPAFMVALVFLLYPGMSQQFIAICYGHFDLILCLFSLSLGLSLYVIDHPKHRVSLTLCAAALAAINLFSTEYFFMLELLRPILIWVKLAGSEPQKRRRLLQTLSHWWPFAVVFLAGVIWRAFFWAYQSATYDANTLFQQLIASPWSTLKNLVVNILRDLWLTVVAMWKNVFILPAPKDIGGFVTLMYAGITAALAILFWVVLAALQKKESAEPKPANRKSLALILLGFIALLLGGLPYWTTGLQVSESFPNDRFTLSFMLGSGFMITGLLCLLPLRPIFRRSLFVLLLALAGGLQVRIGVGYMADWQALQRFMTQLTWRIPAIKPNTLVFLNDHPGLTYYSDLSLTAPVNLIYKQDADPKSVPYALYYPTIRKSEMDALTMAADLPVEHGLYIGEFNGNTNQAITLYFRPRVCLRVIDPQIEIETEKTPAYLVETAKLSDGLQWIDFSPLQNSEPLLVESGGEDSWCYSFEKADLARQQGDWSQVSTIADKVITGSEKPADPMERLVFIEGDAHTGNWQRTFEMTQTTLQDNPAMNIPLCRLFERIQKELPDSVETETGLDQITPILNCTQ